jgi:hypothetical protein
MCDERWHESISRLILKLIVNHHFSCIYLRVFLKGKGVGHVMVSVLRGVTFYNTAEACAKVGIHKDTYLRWVRKGEFKDVELRDRHGWRIFSAGDLRRLRTKVNRVKTVRNKNLVTPL